jgi:hypothetical protein
MSAAAPRRRRRQAEQTEERRTISDIAITFSLIGAPLNMIAAGATREAGFGGIDFLEFAIARAPTFIGTATILLLLGKYLLPRTSGASPLVDFSAPARALIERYGMEDGGHRLRARLARRAAEAGGRALQADGAGRGGMRVCRQHRDRPRHLGMVNGGCGVRGVGGVAAAGTMRLAFERMDQ